jgi:hypothetical protein
MPVPTIGGTAGGVLLMFGIIILTSNTAINKQALAANKKILLALILIATRLPNIE